MAQNKALTTEQRQGLLEVLKLRFENNEDRHKGVAWSSVEEKLQAEPEKLRSLYEMEETGGEPDVVCLDANQPGFAFVDCSAETPAGRRNLCYDRAALEARKKNKPENCAVDMAKDMGIEILTEHQYRALQQLGEFDLKTSSWVVTPDEIRKRGGALFCDRRYGHVFVYHNGADSYYSVRGFRGMLTL